MEESGSNRQQGVVGNHSVLRLRSGGLAQTNSLLCEQLSQSEQDKQALREDLQKLTADWTGAVRDAEQRESDWLREKEV